jgi:hypothetical protein
MNTIEMDIPGENAPAEIQGPYSLVAGAYALGLMMSPDNLALLGQITGHFGYYATLLIAGTLVLYLIYARSYAQQYAHYGNSAGTWFAFYPLTVRILTAVVVATGLTVSSGFMFNEVFVYWFPNFAFAFIMLGLVGVLNFLGPAAQARAQTIFLGTAISGLVLLTAIGLARGPFLETLPKTPEHTIALPWLFLPLLLFVGFDMGLPSGRHSVSRRNVSMTAVKTAMALFGMLIILWSIAMALHVPGERLMSTSIAHMIAARHISGQTGRIIMGVVVICGSLAAVNALFESVIRMTATLQQQLLPRMMALPKAVVGLVVVVIAVLMATGFAGEEGLETWIRTAMLLWLVGYGMLSMRLATRQPSTGASLPMRSKTSLLIAAATSFSGTAILVLTDAQVVLMYKIILAVIGLSLILGAIGKWHAEAHA